MAAKSSYKRKIKRKIRKSPIIIAILLILALAAFLFVRYGDKIFGTAPFETEESGTTAPEVPQPADGEVLFHMLDVGQGDAILVTSSAGNMLIDTSISSERTTLRSYLSKLGINSFEYVVFTHPDADHIGSADHIIKNYDIKNIIMPDFAKTTDTYNKMLDAIEQSEANLILIGEGEDCEQAGYSFYLGSMLNTIMGPTEDFKTSNEMSVVIKSSYGDTSILLTGDAEYESERKMLEKWGSEALDCDVLKVGHHGSSTSTTDEFLAAVSPSIAVISCGKNNKFNHPNKETTDKLIDASIKYYRTDIDGDVVLRTDGEAFTVVED